LQVALLRIARYVLLAVNTLDETTLSECILRWFQTRHYRECWKSIPAVLALAACVACILILAGWRRIETRAHYSEVARKALATKDYLTARLACERALSAGSQPREAHLFYLAIALQGLGREEDALVLLRLAAPLDKPGYPPAQIYAANSLLAGGKPTPAASKLARAHLEQVLAAEPDSVEANEMLGWLYFESGDWKPARQCLLAVVPNRPEAALPLAVVAGQLGDEAGLRAWAERAAKYRRERVENAKLDSPTDRLRWAQALMLEQKFAEAMKVLDDGRKQSGTAQYGPAIGDLCASWAHYLSTNQPAEFLPRLKLIDHGLGYAPQNVRLVKMLVELSRLHGPEAQAARDAMSKLMADKGASPLVHLIIGGDAWQDGDTEQARKQFTLAYELAPNLPVVANNMAAVLAKGDPADLPRALDLIQPLVEKFPNDPHFRDTRGQILTRLGRWQEAVKDLEMALPLLSPKGPTYAALAEDYRQLGLSNLAARYEQLAKAPDEHPPPVSRDEVDDR
jgi:tetratricopeptide (TPR) repeat protein